MGLFNVFFCAIVLSLSTNKPIDTKFLKSDIGQRGWVGLRLQVIISFAKVHMHLLTIPCIMHGLHGDVLIRTDEVRDPLLFTRVEVSGRNHNCQFDGFSYLFINKWASETYPPKLSPPRVLRQAFFFFTNMHALCSPKRYSSNQYRIVRVPIFPHTKILNWREKWQKI